MEFYETLKSISNNINELKQKRRNAFDSVRDKYAKNVLKKQWIAFINNGCHQ